MDGMHQGHRERLRARLEAEGADALSDQTLVELLLTYAIPRQDTEGTAYALLQRFHTLEGILSASDEELLSVDGVGKHALEFLRMLQSFEGRIARGRLQDDSGRTVLSAPDKAAQFVYGLLKYERNEKAILVLLDVKRGVLATETIGNGTLAEVTVYPRTCAELALKFHAHSAILAHCHPSGDPTHSRADTETTRAVQNALSAIGVQLLDHLVVGDRKLYSFATKGFISLDGTEEGNGQ